MCGILCLVICSLVVSCMCVHVSVCLTVNSVQERMRLLLPPTIWNYHLKPNFQCLIGFFSAR